VAVVAAVVDVVSGDVVTADVPEEAAVDIFVAEDEEAVVPGVAQPVMITNNIIAETTRHRLLDFILSMAPHTSFDEYKLLDIAGIWVLL
jgi:hypothetical protein